MLVIILDKHKRFGNIQTAVIKYFKNSLFYTVQHLPVSLDANLPKLMMRVLICQRFAVPAEAEAAARWLFIILKRLNQNQPC